MYLIDTYLRLFKEAVDINKTIVVVIFIRNFIKDLCIYIDNICYIHSYTK